MTPDGETQPAAILMGGAPAIRRAVAMRLAKRNLSVLLCDPDEDVLHAVEAELRRDGYPIIALRADPGVMADLRRVAKTAIARCGRIAALVNGPVDLRPEERTGGDGNATTGARVSTLQACLRGTQAFVPHIAAGGGGQIVHLLSSAARYRSAYFQTGEDSHALEAVAGGAILALTRQLAFELAPRRIRVNAVVAGLIEGAIAKSEWEEASERDRAFILEEISLGRLGKPDEVAAAIEFLALDVSSYVTGTGIDVNGGWWMS